MLEGGTGSRMDREDDRLAHLLQGRDDGAKRLWLHVGLPVDREQEVRPRLDARIGESARAIASQRCEANVRVEHHVADEMNGVLGDPFLAQISDCNPAGSEEERGEVISGHTIDLLRHTAIERAGARLHVRDRDVQLGGRERACERRIGVAVDQRPVRPFLQQHLLDSPKHAAGLLAVWSGADAEMMLRLCKLELLEEQVRHGCVVVLAGVHYDLAQARSAQRARHRGRLDELRPVSDDGKDFHGGGEH